MLYKKEIELAGKPLTIEVGRLAKFADGSAWVRYGDNVVIATVVSSKNLSENLDFFPLSVDYREKMSAAGKIPGGFFKREGRPSEREILAARMIDRPIRPLFPKSFHYETQVMTSVLSSDGETNLDFLGTLASSTAICVSDIPFAGPIATIRVCLIDDEFVLNPPTKDTDNIDMELVVSGTEDSIIMVEGEGKEVSEQQMISAIYHAHESIRQLIQIQKELMAECGKPKREIVEEETPDQLMNLVKDKVGKDIIDLTDIQDKAGRGEGMSKIYDSLIEELGEEYEEEARTIREIVSDMFRTEVRRKILEESKRPDGRGLTEIRQITSEVALLPRVHGSSIFTRGQTQALASVTLGTKIDEQRIDSLDGDYTERFMLHYNFPPYCVGEIRRFLGTSRREVGHGNLAGRAIKAILPKWDIFPYTIRVVSDILESNGSSSMASVCAGCLALMDAGAPIKDMVAGIAMGLISEDDKLVILSDILGEEDHLGDMDFKVAGTRKGITAVQMDIKIQGIPAEVMERALMQAHGGRLHILDKMAETMAEPRDHMSPYAPRILFMKVEVDKIGAIIGPGGKIIRDIIEKTGANIDIDDDGQVCISSPDGEACNKAKAMVQALVQEPEVGKVYDGTVKRIMDFGAFVEILPGKEGLLHISQIELHRINNVSDVLKVGDAVKVKLLKIDDQGRLDLSRKVLLRNDDEKRR